MSKFSIYILFCTAGLLVSACDDSINPEASTVVDYVNHVATIRALRIDKNG